MKILRKNSLSLQGAKITARATIVAAIFGLLGVLITIWYSNSTNIPNSVFQNYGSGNIYVGITDKHKSLSLLASSEDTESNRTDSMVSLIERNYYIINGLSERLKSIEIALKKKNDQKLRDAKKLLESGEFESADVEFSDIISQNKNTIEIVAEAYYQKCELKATKKRYSIGLEDCQKAADLIPENARYLFVTGQLAFLTKRDSLAVRYFEKFIKLGYTYPPTLRHGIRMRMIAASFFHVGKVEQGLHYTKLAHDIFAFLIHNVERLPYGQTILVSRHIAQNYRDMAMIYFDRSEFQKSITLNQKALEITHVLESQGKENIKKLVELYQRVGYEYAHMIPCVEYSTKYMEKALSLMKERKLVDKKRENIIHLNMIRSQVNAATYLGVFGILEKSQNLFVSAMELAVKEYGLESREVKIIKEYKNSTNVHVDSINFDKEYLEFIEPIVDSIVTERCALLTMPFD